VTLLLVGIAGLTCLALGCHESELEPESPVRGDWSMAEWQAPVAYMSQSDVPSSVIVNPAPVVYRPRSISLGFIGDAPLTPSAEQGPRWPWVQEPFHMAPSYAYGYGYGRRSRRWR
jgi:hypothetical protein